MEKFDFTRWFDSKRYDDTDMYEMCDIYDAKRLFRECWDTAQKVLKEKEGFNEEAFDKIEDLKSEIAYALKNFNDDVFLRNQIFETLKKY